MIEETVEREVETAEQVERYAFQDERVVELAYSRTRQFDPTPGQVMERGG